MTLARRRTRVVLLAAALTLTGAPLATAGSAHAGTWSHRDDRGDVVRMSAAGDRPTVTMDAQDRAADITKFTVRHTTRKVVLTLRLRDLRAGDSFVGARLVTPRSEYDLTVMRTSDLRMFTLSDTSDDYATVACRGKKQSFDTRRDKVTITIPRTCLGSPAWVRAGAGYVRGNLMSMDEAETITLDEALRKGNKSRATSDAPLKVGKKVRAG